MNLEELEFKRKRFIRFGVITIVSVYVLILVGGIVRSTGSGMGCPDWPKCFGSWVPPTSVEQLPEDYQEIYKEKRIAKNEKLAAMLGKLGFNEASKDIFYNPAVFIETEFNVTKTWIEYLNRLVGVLIGIFIFLTLIYSIPFIKRETSIFVYSLLSFIVVGLQGWIGSVVVSTNLFPVVVTVHMGLALVLVGLLIYAVLKASRMVNLMQELRKSNFFLVLLWAALLTTFIQILLGTQVREQVDLIAFNEGYLNRDIWVEKLGDVFEHHRTFSIFILILNVGVLVAVTRLKDAFLKRVGFWMIGFVILEVVIGVVLSRFAIPAFLQPIHLLLATLIFGVQFVLLSAYLFKVKKKEAFMAVKVSGDKVF